jgi:hypothetical protein
MGKSLHPIPNTNKKEKSSLKKKKRREKQYKGYVSNKVNCFLPPVPVLLDSAVVNIFVYEFFSCICLHIAGNLPPTFFDTSFFWRYWGLLNSGPRP